MNNAINSQIKHELRSWLRLIEFFRQENALLKYRLSELVDNSDDGNFVQIAEYFQNEFLLKDEALKRLITDLQDHSDIVEDRETFSENLLGKHSSLRNHIQQFEEKYSKLSTEFNEKMLLSN
ncbi:MAG: hypothetical protein ABI366_04375 [Ginsengibacter sp.]